MNICKNFVFWQHRNLSQIKLSSQLPCSNYEDATIRAEMSCAVAAILQESCVENYHLIAVFYFEKCYMLK